MDHSITFIDIDYPSIRHNTWEDWHLIPSSRPVIKPPELTTKYVEIPGRNGLLDLSDVALGFPTFKDRSGSLEFYVYHDDIEHYRWAEVYSTVLHYIHGRKLKMVLADDPEFYYEGRFVVNDWASDKSYSKIVINYQVGPFKKRIVAFNEPWIWDPFNFKTGIITKEGLVTAPYSITVTGSLEPVSITFVPEADTDLTVVYTYLESPSDVPIVHPLVQGENTFNDVYLRWGENQIDITGTGSATIIYRGGEL